MKKLDHLIPFLTLLLIFAMLLVMGNSSFGAVSSSGKICTFKLHPEQKGRMKSLIPAGMYRIMGQKNSSGYAYGNFQRLQNTRHGKIWTTLGETRGGSRLTVSLHNHSDNLILYFNENKTKHGSCVLEGSLHSWI